MSDTKLWMYACEADVYAETRKLTGLLTADYLLGWRSWTALTRLGSAANEPPPPPPNLKKEKALVLPSEAELFHFDLKVFAASLTVMRSGESVRTAGIWRRAEKLRPGNRQRAQTKSKKEREEEEDLRWLGKRFAVTPPSSRLHPSVNFPNVWDSRVGGWRCGGGRVGTEAAGCFSLQQRPQTKRRRFCNLTSWLPSSPLISQSRSERPRRPKHTPRWEVGRWGAVGGWGGVEMSAGSGSRRRHRWSQKQKHSDCYCCCCLFPECIRAYPLSTESDNQLLQPITSLDRAANQEWVLSPGKMASCQRIQSCVPDDSECLSLWWFHAEENTRITSSLICCLCFITM